MTNAVQMPAVREGPSPATRKGILFAAMAVAFVYLVVGGPYWPNRPVICESIQWFGLALVVICILGRTWCALYIGGIKNETLVTHGPYSICRNPLYLFSIIGTIGVGAQFGSITIIAFIALLACANFSWWANSEETRLIELFGDDYRQYHDRVPRFLPSFGQWRDLAVIPIRPRAVINTFADSLFLLISIPIAVGFDYLHEIGVLRAYVSLP